MLNNMRRHNLRQSEYFNGHGIHNDEDVFDFSLRFSPHGQPYSPLHYGVMVTVVDSEYKELMCSVRFFRDAKNSGRMFNYYMDDIVPKNGPKKELLRAKAQILSDILNRLPGVNFEFNMLTTEVERAHHKYSLPQLIAATVHYRYSTGEELVDYLTSQLEVDEDIANTIREIFLMVEP